MNELIIIRGLPGSGKSTLATRLAECFDYLHYEADMYFMVDGEYKFDLAVVNKAHMWCQRRVETGLKYQGVVVSNTFSRLWEMDFYLKLPNPKTIIECQGNYGNIHGVPDEVVERMKNRWESI